MSMSAGSPTPHPTVPTLWGLRSRERPRQAGNFVAVSIPTRSGWNGFSRDVEWDRVGLYLQNVPTQNRYKGWRRLFGVLWCDLCCGQLCSAMSLKRSSDLSIFVLLMARLCDTLEPLLFFWASVPYCKHIQYFTFKSILILNDLLAMRRKSRKYTSR